MLTNKLKTKLLVDGGDPDETLRVKTLIGFVDGQTTNPSLVAKNPEIQRLIASGHRLSSEETNEYNIAIHPNQTAPMDFTFFWKESNHWEGRNHEVSIQRKNARAVAA